MIERNKVYVGDNLDILKTFPDNSIDSVVTDPPYGLGKEPNALEVLQSWITKGYHEISGKGFMGKEWDAFVPQPNFWKEVYRVLKPGGYVLSFAGTRTYDWMVMAVRLAGFEIRDMIAWVYGSGFPKSRDIAKDIEKKQVGGIKNLKVIGEKDGIKAENGVNGFSYNKEYVAGISIGGKQKNGKIPIYEINSNEAKQWQGWGTALKPALEPIVMARKPLDGTVAQNVLKHGVGGINIDGCRVGDGERFLEPATPSKGTFNASFDSDYNGKTVNGRFPANVIHDGSDEVVSLFPYSKAGEYKGEGTKSGGIWNKSTGQPAGREYGDEGSASRFFYCAKASQEERNFGLYDFPSKQKVFNGQSSKPSKDMKGVELKFSTKPQKNIHPTVKPIDLMRYLVRLVTPPNGICLDPFLGSGTTAVACKAEKFDYIGIELIPEYAEIAEARIKAEVVKYDIFDFIDESK